LNDLGGLSEPEITKSVADGTGWEQSDDDIWHQMGVDRLPDGTKRNRKYINTADGREAVFTGNDLGRSVLVTDHNGSTYNYGKNPVSHVLYDVIPYFFEGAGPLDNTTFLDRINACTIACSLN